MGYTSNASGQININPPLTWGEIKDSPYLPDRVNRDGNWRDAQLITTDPFWRATNGGHAYLRTAVAIEPTSPEESMKRYDLKHHLSEIVTAYPDRTYTGAINCIGEDGYQWRYVIRDGVVVEQRPTIVWPDDEPECVNLDDPSVPEYRTLGEFCAAVAGPKHDNAVEATLQWMVAELSKEADDREKLLGPTAKLHFSAEAVRVLVADKAEMIRRYRAMDRGASRGD